MPRAGIDGLRRGGDVAADVLGLGNGGEGAEVRQLAAGLGGGYGTVAIEVGIDGLRGFLPEGVVPDDVGGGEGNLKLETGNLGKRQDCRIHRIGISAAPCRMAGCERIAPVVLPLFHGVILHRPAVTGNWEQPQKGTKNHKKGSHTEVTFRVLLCVFVAMVFLPANLRQGKAFFSSWAGANLKTATLCHYSGRTACLRGGLKMDSYSSSSSLIFSLPLAEAISIAVLPLASCRFGSAP